jgi:DHA2 family multidrug resistance protein-like MFS transporter
VRRSPAPRTTSTSKDSVQNELTKSFAGAESVPQRYPQSTGQITAAAKQSFFDGADWAYPAGLIAVLLGAALVFFLFPKREAEERLLEQYHAEDTGRPEPERLRAIA